MITARANVKVDRAKLQRRLEAKQVRILFRTGGQTRTIMQRSMPYRKGKSKPGQPPHAHKDTEKGPLLRKLVRFHVDRRAKRVVTGPILTERVGAKTVPELLDQGGRIPAKRNRRRPATMAVGKAGPVRIVGPPGKRRWVPPRGGKLTSAAQVDRANRLLAEEQTTSVSTGSVAGKIAPRPFRAPAFQQGLELFRELTEKEPL